MHGFPEYLLTFETGNSCSQLRYSLQIFEPPRAPRGEGPRQCPQDISTSHCVPRVKINPGDGWGERCAAPSSKSQNLAWTPSHRYHWHVATPAVSAKKGPHLIEFQLNNTSRGSRMRGGGFVPGGWSLPGAIICFISVWGRKRVPGARASLPSS